MMVNEKLWGKFFPEFNKSENDFWLKKSKFCSELEQEYLTRKGEIRDRWECGDISSDTKEILMDELREDYEELGMYQAFDHPRMVWFV